LQALFEILKGNFQNIKLALDIDLPERLRQFEKTLNKEDNQELVELIQNIQNLLTSTATQNEPLPTN
jgi:Skp family chaperone for outer membrane proteins